MSRYVRLSVAAIVIIVAAGAFLGFTRPGHQLLRQMSLMSACASSDGC